MRLHANNKPVFNFVVSRALFLAIGLLLVGAGIAALLKQRSNSLFGGSLFLLGLCILFFGIKGAADVFRGKSVLEETVTLSLPGRAACELSVPSRMTGGRVILFFEETPERYAGKITLQKVPIGDASSVSANLPKLEPSRMKVPKWLPTSDAGKVLENWPRRTGQSTDPVVLEFTFPVEPEEKLKLDFELESNFKGTKLEDRFPITGQERVRVFVKE